MIEVKDADIQETEDKIFGKTEERAIIALAFDQPDFVSSIIPYLKIEYFTGVDTKYVFSLIKEYFDKHSIIMTRQICHDMVERELTANDPHVEILGLIDKESDPREVPIITERLISWARQQAYAQLYSEEAIQAHESGDYEVIENIIEEARKVVNIGGQCKFFFNEIDQLFIKENQEKLTVGFPRLDAAINLGGPCKKEVFCWMAPTGVGKCHTLESKIIIDSLSRIYELEYEINGQIQIVRAAGFREVQTSRGRIKVCNLTQEDNLMEIPAFNDAGDISVSIV